MRKKDRYCQLGKNDRIIRFKKGEIVHVKNYDEIQDIYGIPDWIHCLQAALLNQDSKLFRRKYYLNGCHMGYILFTNSQKLSKSVEESIHDSLKNSKGPGNFRSMYVHIPGADKEAVQIIPVGQIDQRDQFEKISRITADDVIVSEVEGFTY